MPRRRSLTTVIGLLVLAAACSDDHGPGGDPTTPTAPASPPAEAEIAVTLQQYRADEVAHRIGLQVTSHAAAPIDIATARLDWPGLAPIAPTELAYPLVPGVTVDLRVDYGTAVCGDPPRVDDPAPDAPIVAEVTTADGKTLRWPVDDVRGVLARVHELDCRRQAVDHLVGVAIGTAWAPSPEGDAVTGELVLTRRAATGPVAITGISGSVLLNVDLADGAGAEMTGDHAVVPIVVTSAQRCEAHALADSKKTFDFQVSLLVDGVAASISVGPDPADETTVFRPVVVTCGLV